MAKSVVRKGFFSLDHIGTDLGQKEGFLVRGIVFHMGFSDILTSFSDILTTNFLAVAVAVLLSP